MSERRRLAAIVAADVVGYSRLMGRDERGTLARLLDHRKQRLEPIVARHGGRIVKLTGDGTLIEFASAVEAVSAAIEFQQAMDDVNLNGASDQIIVFRIGVHLGDLIVEGDDLYGDGVNVAARLEAEAPAGGVLVSYSVRDAVEGRLEATLRDLGDLSLKNIERPVRVFRVEWSAADWRVPTAAPVSTPAKSETPLALPDKPSIAVLPFQNMSGDPEQEYFADGVVEDIITALSRFKSLFVIARNSTFTYKGKAVDVRQVGRELGVRYVLEGSVRKAARRLRITGQLIDAESGSHLWADRFEGALDDVFDLQDRVTTSVVTAIAPQIDRVEMGRVRRKPLASHTTYDLLLRAMARRHERTDEGRREALWLYRQAIALDPGLGAAYAGAAHCYGSLRQIGRGGDLTEEQAEVRRLVKQATQLARDDPRALVDCAFALIVVCGDHQAAGAMTDEALEINPHLVYAWTMRGWVSLWTGQHEAALDQFARAIRLGPRDPDLPVFYRGMGAACLHLERYAEAIAWWHKVLSHSADDLVGLRNLAMTLALSGNPTEAKHYARRLLELLPDFRISRFAEYFSLLRPEDIERAKRGLRLASFPE